MDRLKNNKAEELTGGCFYFLSEGRSLKVWSERTLPNPQKDDHKVCALIVIETILISHIKP